MGVLSPRSGPRRGAPGRQALAWALLFCACSGGEADPAPPAEVDLPGTPLLRDQQLRSSPLRSRRARPAARLDAAYTGGPLVDGPGEGPPLGRVVADLCTGSSEVLAQALGPGEAEARWPLWDRAVAACPEVACPPLGAWAQTAPPAAWPIPALAACGHRHLAGRAGDPERELALRTAPDRAGTSPPADEHTLDLVARLPPDRAQIALPALLGSEHPRACPALASLLPHLDPSEAERLTGRPGGLCGGDAADPDQLAAALRWDFRPSDFPPAARDPNALLACLQGPGWLPARAACWLALREHPEGAAQLAFGFDPQSDAPPGSPLHELARSGAQGGNPADHLRSLGLTLDREPDPRARTLSAAWASTGRGLTQPLTDPAVLLSVLLRQIPGQADVSAEAWSPTPGTFVLYLWVGDERWRVLVPPSPEGALGWHVAGLLNALLTERQSPHRVVLGGDPLEPTLLWGTPEELQRLADAGAPPWDPAIEGLAASVDTGP